MAMSIISNIDSIKDISSILLMGNGKLKLLPSKDYKYFSPDEIKYFCYKYARYGLPTLELITYLKEQISGRSAIEIGSGHGDLGYHLAITMTDSKIQLDPEVKAYYKALQQPIIEYPNDVEKLEALKAIEKYKPKVVIGSWVTAWIDPNEPPTRGGSIYGVKEDKLLDNVETYILIGNLDVHGDKPILKRKHRI